ncbi:MAG: glycerate kinase [Phycisphaerales bacterium]
MNQTNTIPKALPPEVHNIAAGIIASTLAACDPAIAPQNHSPTELNHARSVRVLAFGKAAAHMAAAAIDQLDDRLSQAVIICPPEHIHLVNHPRATVHPADHPLPTERNIAAADAIEQCARSADPNEPTLVLISGGGSAHLTSPRPGVTLEHIRETTKQLLRAGADIHELNTARRQLERLKAGGLLHACASQSVHALVLSDVLTNDLNTIASGPLMATDLPAYRPPAQHTIIADNQTAVSAAANAMRSHKLDPLILGQPLTGEASVAAKRLTARAIETNQPILAGGETTVTVGSSTGLGGRNLELALVAALAMPMDRSWTVLTFASDGIDGPTDAAGAVLTSEMFQSRAARAEATAALANHDSYPAIESMGGLIRTGPTGTNVNDIAAVWFM